MPNDIPIWSVALDILCQYPMKKIRSDMSFDEYTAYKNDWNIFNHVWAYNYTVRALGSGSYYQFSSDSERISYRRGQLSHTSVYSDAVASGIFNDIP